MVLMLNTSELTCKEGIEEISYTLFNVTIGTGIPSSAATTTGMFICAFCDEHVKGIPKIIVMVIIVKSLIPFILLRLIIKIQGPDVPGTGIAGGYIY